MNIAPKKVSFNELSVQEVNLILRGLGHLPANQSMSLILKLESLAEAQLNPPPAPPAPAPATDAEKDPPA